MTYKQEKGTAKRSWRKGLSLLLSLAMLAGLLPTMATTALAADTALTPSNNGTVTATNGGSYIISASGTYTGWRFVVPSGVAATLTVSGTLTLNNQSGGGSPIDIQAGGNLTLVVDKALAIYGQNATNGADSNPTVTPAGGNGGYAAIAVPDKATLNVKGIGAINAYGGSAGKGGSSALNGAHGNASGGGGGGAGAGIGGNGGNGGAGVANVNNQSGTTGGSGLAAGNIYFSESITTTAFGGGGGTAGQPNKSSGAGGGGGYPGAGIGGGGAGGGGADHGSGGGGFSGGGGQVETRAGVNGMGATAKGDSSDEFGSGGGYFSVGNDGNYAGPKKYSGGPVGGGYANTWDWGTHSGEGGTAGAGGNVKIYTASANIKAYNGNYITTSASGASGNNWGQNPTPIYAQLGYSLDNIRAKSIASVTARTDAAMSSELVSKGVAKTISTTGVSGIGSGAGYTESSNGTVQYGTRLDLGTLNADLHLTPSSNGGVPYVLYGTQNQYNVVIDSGNVMLILDSATINISNQTGKSAIDVKPGASLTLEVIGVNKLYGGIGEQGLLPTVDYGSEPYPTNKVVGGLGGIGGGAGVAVPAGAVANISGSGTLYAYGGDAGDSSRNGAGAYPAAGIGGGGGGAGGGGGYPPKRSGTSGGGGGGGAGAGIGGIGGGGGQGGGGYVDAEPGKNGTHGGSAGTITVNAKIYAYGGGGASAQGANGGGGASLQGGGDGAGGGGFSGGNGGNGGGGGGYFSAGASTTAPGGALYGGGGRGINSYSGVGGDGGAGGSGGTITIVDKNLVYAQNGSKITTSTSASQSWAAANATPIRTQATQGYGAGAGYTETDGKVVFMGAPGAPTSVSATLSGTYGDSAAVSWNVPASTGGDGVALTGYTVKSVEFGINRTLAPADYTVSNGRVTVTLTGLPHNTKGTFTVYALNAKGSSVESTPSNELTTKGVPLAPRNVEAHMIDGTVDKAAALWNGPDISYNNIKMTGDANYGKHRGKARQKQAHISHRQGQRWTNLLSIRAPCDCAKGARGQKA